MDVLESLSAWLHTVPHWAQMFAILALPTGLIAWILHVGTRPEVVEQRVEVPVEVVPPTLARLAAHLNWSPEDDANEGVSIGSRIASHYAELIAERDEARNRRCDRCADAEAERRRHIDALNSEWARANHELRGQRDAWRERALRYERTHDHASNTFLG